MEAQWELDRICLFQLMQENPKWSLARLAQATGHCLSWVKKWRKRFREAPQATLEMFKSQSRAPKTRPIAMKFTIALLEREQFCITSGKIRHCPGNICHVRLRLFGKF
jgi:hypothetical protein